MSLWACVVGRFREIRSASSPSPGFLRTYLNQTFRSEMHEMRAKTAQREESVPICDTPTSGVPLRIRAANPKGTP